MSLHSHPDPTHPNQKTNDYPFADDAVMDVGKDPQVCAYCGFGIVLNPGDAMTFDTRPNTEAPSGFDILTLHIECDARNTAFTR